MLLLPSRARAIGRGGAMVDLFYSLFIFLLIAVLVLGSLAFMLLRQALYIEAVSTPDLDGGAAAADRLDVEYAPGLHRHRCLLLALSADHRPAVREPGCIG
jgi:hypothetical protein